MSEISDEMIDAAFRIFKGEMLMYEEDRSLIERMLRAALVLSEGHSAPEPPPPIPAPDHKRRIADYAANVQRQRDLVRKTRGE